MLRSKGECAKMCERGTWSQIQFLPQGILGLLSDSCVEYIKSPLGLVTMSGPEGPHHGEDSCLSVGKKIED